MRKIYLICTVLWGCLCLSACTEQGDWTNYNISLCAEVEQVESMSRSQYATPVSDNNLTATVWFSLEQSKYPEGTGTATETNIPGHYEIDFRGEDAVFPNVANENMRPRYPVDNTPVYCVGFYPHTDWTYVEENPSKATHDISGFEDLMFAAPIMGSWNQHFGRQRFWHLLSWLKVCVCATTAEAGNYWGKLKKITLKDVPIGLQINNLSKMYSEYPNGKLAEGDVSPLKDDNGNEILHSVDILDETNGLDLGIVIKDVGSVFCYPQSSYTLFIECENGKIEKTIDLKPLAGSGSIPTFPVGAQFVLILNFHPFNVVEGVCTLKEWNAQNEDLYPTN